MAENDIESEICINELQAEIARLQQELQHLDDERQAYRERFTNVVSSICSGSIDLGNIHETPRTIIDEEYIKKEGEKRVAEHKALELLECKIGKDNIAKISAGGAYPIRSKQWRDIIYYVPRNPNEKVKVMLNGAIIMESCIVTTDHTLPWPDVMLQRILALEIDETIVVETGVIKQNVPEKRLNRLRALFKKMIQT